MRVFYNLSLGRTGHHAIQYWLFQQRTKRVKYITDEPKFGRGLDYCGDKDSLYVSVHANWTNITSLVSCLNKDAFVIINNESPIYAKCDSNLNIHSHTPLINSYDKILIARDFYNQIASEIRRDEEHKSKDELQQQLFGVRERWLTHAREIIGKTNYFKGYTILFNNWFSDSKYREKICKDLNLKFTDLGIDRVPKHAGGSSFDKMGYNHRADKMNVLKRYEKYINDERLTSLITDEIISLNKEIYNIEL